MLKHSHQIAPGDERIAVALAWEYLHQGNRLWALRTARHYIEEHPSACAVRALLIWSHLQMANLELAEEAVAEPGCRSTPEEQARFAMLKVHVAEQRRDARAFSWLLHR